MDKLNPEIPIPRIIIFSSRNRRADSDDIFLHVQSAVSRQRDGRRHGPHPWLTLDPGQASQSRHQDVRDGSEQ